MDSSLIVGIVIGIIIVVVFLALRKGSSGGSSSSSNAPTVRRAEAPAPPDVRDKHAAKAAAVANQANRPEVATKRAQVSAGQKPVKSKHRIEEPDSHSAKVVPRKNEKQSKRVAPEKGEKDFKGKKDSVADKNLKHQAGFKGEKSTRATPSPPDHKAGKTKGKSEKDPGAQRTKRPLE